MIDTRISKVLPTCGLNFKNAIIKAKNLTDLLPGNTYELADLISCEESNVDHRNQQRLEFLSGSLVEALAKLLKVDHEVTRPYRVVDSKCFGDIDWRMSLLPEEDADSLFILCLSSLKAI